jgi:tape measure domain-containing protein
VVIYMLVGEVFARMGLDSRQYEEGLGRLEGVTRREATTLGSVFRNAFSVALGISVFEAVKRGFRAVVGESISFNAQMEQARIGFTTMLGSAERAEVFLRDMADFAVRTPFEFPELLDASKRMLAYGFAAEDVLPTMEAVGNASAAVGLGTEGINRIILALGQMRAKGKLSAEEMRQLTETGIPAWEILAEAMNKTTAEIMDMQSKGLIPADRAIKMLVEGMNKRFPNMMSQMEDTWEGVTSTIKDIWQMTIGALTSNLFNGLKTWLQGVRDWAVDFYDTFQKYGLQAALIKAFGAEIANTIISIGNAVKMIMQLVSGLFQLWVKWWKLMIVPTLGFQKVILRLVLYFFVFFKAVALAKIITQRFAYVMGILRGQTYVTGGAFGFLSAAVQYYRYQLRLANMAGITSLGVMAKMVIGIRSIGVAIKGLLASIPIIGWIVLAIGLLAEAAIYAYYNWEKVKHYGLQAWSALKQGIAYYIYGILSLYRLLFGWIPGAGKAFDVLRKKALEVAKAETAIRKARAQAFAQKPLDPYAEYEKKMEEYHKQLEEYEASLESSFAGAKDGADKTTDSIEKMNKVAGDGIQSFDEVHQLMEQAGDAAGELDDVLGLDLGLEEMPEMPEMPKMPTLEETGILKKISGMWDDIASSISTGTTEAWAEFGDTMKEAWEAFKGDWEKIFKAFTWENIKQKFVDGWTGFQSWFSQTWAGQIWDKVKIKWQEVREEFTWANIKQMFVNGWTGFQSWFSQTWAGKIWDGVKQKWGNLKKDAPETWEDIKESIRTRWEKLKRDAPDTWDNIKKSIAERWEMLKKDAPETWENIKKTIAERWEKLKIDAPSVWENIKKEISNRWETLKIDAPIVWENIKKGISERWEALRTSAPTTWEEIRKNISDRWEALKTDAPTAWGNIRKSIGDKWEELKTNAPITWEEIKKEITDRWEALKTDAPTAWGNIRKSIGDKWEELKTNAPITWEEIKKEITDRWEALKTDAPTAWEDIAGSIKRIWEGIKETAGDIWDSMTNDVIKGAINGIIDLINRLIDMWNSLKFEVPSITIGNKTFGGYTVRVPQIDPITPLAKGGLVTDPTLAMLGEAGPEAVIPLGRSGFAGDLADTVAQAVYRAIMDAIRIAQASSQQSDDRELVLKIDNTVLARMQLPAIIREGQRQGLNLVVQPQGV